MDNNRYIAGTLGRGFWFRRGGSGKPDPYPSGRGTGGSGSADRQRTNAESLTIRRLPGKVQQITESGYGHCYLGGSDHLHITNKSEGH